LKAEELPIRWIVKEGHDVNKLQAERLYLEATRWIENRFGSPKQVLRPALTIHVGEPCPDPAISKACQTTRLGDLYIPKWDNGSAGYIVQATLMSSLLDLMSREELRTVALELIDDDFSNFLDSTAVAQRMEK